MNITDNGLKEIENLADRRHDFVTLLICQILRELRELRKLIDISHNADDCGNSSADCADKSQNEHG